MGYNFNNNNFNKLFNIFNCNDLIIFNNTIILNIKYLSNCYSLKYLIQPRTHNVLDIFRNYSYFCSKYLLKYFKYLRWFNLILIIIIVINYLILFNFNKLILIVKLNLITK